MTYRLEIERRAQKAVARLPKGDQARIVAAIDRLGEDPRPVGCAPVEAAPKGTYRLRLGDYRVAYLVLDDEGVVIVARVARGSETTRRRPG